MAGYFSNFPIIRYSLDDSASDNIQYVTNILQRSTFLKEVLDNSALYYQYEMKDGETVEQIADKLYGDSNRHWVILLFNKVTNPNYEFPLTAEELDSYIENKYGISVTESQVTIHHYEQQIVRSTVLNGLTTDTNTDVYTVSEYSANYDTGELTPRTLPTLYSPSEVSTEQIPLNPPANTLFLVQTSSIAAVSIYDYEAQLNEDRRKINLLDASYISKVETEFKRLMSTNG
jgi:hypothetical protein